MLCSQCKGMLEVLLDLMGLQEVTAEGQIPFAVCRKGVTLISFCASFLGVACLRYIMVLEVN